MPGDVNNDWLVDLGDVLYFVSYLYQGGPEPQPELCVGEVNGQDPVDLGDLLYRFNGSFVLVKRLDLVDNMP